MVRQGTKNEVGSATMKFGLDRMVDEYRRRIRSEPSLSLAEFVAEHAVSVGDFRDYLLDSRDEAGYFVTLWHGTTRSRARTILRQGFRAEKSERERGLTFFTLDRSMANRYARTKARAEGDRPAVIMCSIDLIHYSNYAQPEPHIYAFSHEHIGSEVIKDVDGLSKRRREKLSGQRNTDVEAIDVALTFNSGRAGIAYWLNSFLKLSGADRIDEDHESVGKIKEWLDAQVDEGRFGIVPDDEILKQIHEYMEIDYDN